MDGEAVRCILGVGGSGKTHLLRSIIDRWQREGSTVGSCGGRPGGTVAYGGVEALLSAEEHAGLPSTAERPETSAAHRRVVERLATGTQGLVVDDTHLLDRASLRLLIDVGLHPGGSVRLVLARRPGRVSGALSRLESLGGPATVIGPLSTDGLRRLSNAWAGHEPSERRIAVLAELSGGLARYAEAIVRAWAEAGVSGDGVPNRSPRIPWLVECIRAERDDLPPPARSLLTALSLGVCPRPDVLGDVTGLDRTQLELAGMRLADAGLMSAERSAVIPVVADAVRAVVPAVERDRIHEGITRAALAGIEPAQRAAARLVAAGAEGAHTIELYAAAAIEAVGEAPGEASSWLARAEAMGASATVLAVPRAEFALSGGELDEALRLADVAVRDADPAGRVRAMATAATAFARRGSWSRAAELYEQLAIAVSDANERVVYRYLAAIGFATIGEIERARRIVAGIDAETPIPTAMVLTSVGLVARALLASLAPACGSWDDGPPSSSTLAPLLEAAGLQAVARQRPELPDRAQFVAAIVAHHLLEFELAEHVLAARADDEGLPAQLGVRQQLLRAWTALRRGRWSTALATAEQHRDDQRHPLELREELLVCAIEVGVARRQGDLAALAAAWSRARTVLLAQPVDLLLLQPYGELMIGAARIGDPAMAGSCTEHVWRLLDRLGEPPLWTFQVRWDELQTAVVASDVEAVGRSAKAMDALGPPGDRAAALVDVAAAWAEIVRGRVDGGFVERAATRLGEVGLPWEASRVAGSAAVRTDEPGVMRRLLGVARDLQASSRSTAGAQPATGLSAREREVASYVLTGMTHKQIGGQLFISPKTVEHHVARIRQKLGVNSREEMLAAIVRLESATP